MKWRVKKKEFSCYWKKQVSPADVMLGGTGVFFCRSISPLVIVTTFSISNANRQLIGTLTG
jgi:hypothetical protein